MFDEELIKELKDAQEKYEGQISRILEKVPGKKKSM